MLAGAVATTTFRAGDQSREGLAPICRSNCIPRARVPRPHACRRRPRRARTEVAEAAADQPRPLNNPRCGEHRTPSAGMRAPRQLSVPVLALIDIHSCAHDVTPLTSCSTKLRKLNAVIAGRPQSSPEPQLVINGDNVAPGTTQHSEHLDLPLKWCYSSKCSDHGRQHRYFPSVCSGLCAPPITSRGVAALAIQTAE
jgi:hypothetical protein